MACPPGADDLRGAKTAKVRKTPVMRVEHEGRYAAVASKGGAPTNPQWYTSLLAEPSIELQDDTQTREYRAREVFGDEKALVAPGRGRLPGLRRLPAQHRPPDPRLRARTDRREHKEPRVMKHISLGGLDISRIGLGAMGMSAYYLDPASSDAESIRTIQRALELGVTHIDTAEIYGPYANEELVGRALKGRRDDVVVATKFGLVSHAGAGAGVVDSSPRTSAPPSRAH